MPPSHPEHPDAFIPHLINRETEAEDNEGTIKARLRKQTPSGVPVVHRPSGVWSSGFGSTLEDVYRDRGAMAPRFTTKTRCIVCTRLGVCVVCCLHIKSVFSTQSLVWHPVSVLVLHSRDTQVISRNSKGDKRPWPGFLLHRGTWNVDVVMHNSNPFPFP